MKRAFINLYIFVIASLLFLQFVFFPLISKVINKYQQPSVAEYDRQLSRGVFTLMERELRRYPESAWPQQIETMCSDFGYAIDIEKIGDINISAENMAELQQGKIVVVEDGEYLFRKIDGSDYVIKKGPFSVLQPEQGRLILIITAVILVVIALLTVIWTLPGWKRLQAITVAAGKFGEGDFSTRVAISKRSGLNPLVNAFNNMAERIQYLISSHKELTNGVAHELRTPLARMRFGLEMLAEAKDSSTRENYLRELRTDVVELEEMVEELLALARLERGKPQLQMIRQELQPFLQQVLFDVRQLDAMVECELHFNVAKNFTAPPFDAKYLSRAIGNLLKNSCTYANSKVNLIAENDGKDLLLHIDDDGPGIVAEFREKVFEPFIRLDTSRSRSSGGHGLGLAIVARIVEWHQGTITITGSPDGGARFTLHLPGTNSSRNAGYRQEW
jgi:signal transduction histidine kinase